MNDNEIIKALKICSGSGYCEECAFDHIPSLDCNVEMAEQALGLIHRQQAKIDELTDRNARLAIAQVCYNIADLNVILESYNVEQLKKRFRAEFEERMELGVEDVNWADWLDSIASEMWEEVKGATDGR